MGFARYNLLLIRFPFVSRSFNPKDSDGCGEREKNDFRINLENDYFKHGKLAQSASRVSSIGLGFQSVERQEDSSTREESPCSSAL